jgi:hypothetical protein
METVIRSAFVLLAGFLVWAATERGPAAAASRDAAASEEARRARGLDAFAVVQKVLQHPRCQNCHIPGDAPLQFDAGTPHQMNVRRGPDGHGSPGLACTTCHDAKNPPDSYGLRVPPGAPDWHLPPPSHKMIFINLSPAELCATIKDPVKTKGKDLAAMLKHIEEDKLVLWGWNPGPGRAPVDTPHAEFVAAFKTWMDAGAPCPPK